MVARGDLYQRDDIAQIENVFTSERQRGSGSATALVVTAPSHAQANGLLIIFLVAAADLRTGRRSCTAASASTMHVW